MRQRSALIVAVLLAVRVAPAIADDADDARPDSAPPARDHAPAAVAPNDRRPDEETDPSGEMLDRWWQEDGVERRDEQREERRDERYEADEPVIEDGPATGDTVEPAPHDTDDELDRDLKLDDDEG